MIKVILISQFPLPFSKIGSWSTLYKNYINNNHQIDYIICEKPEYKFENVEYSFIGTNFLTKIFKKITNQRYFNSISSLAKVINKDDKYIIQIVDNFGIVKPLVQYLEAKKLKKKCYIQFFYHGFQPYYNDFESRSFFESIDEMVLLTYDSYQTHKNYYSELPTRFSVLHNGIDTSRFYAVSEDEKATLKEQKGVLGKKVFVWCSQNRPKKGLFLILDAWKKVYATRKDIILWVIGCEPKEPISGVVYLGKIPNIELPIYFQASDCYLFPTLCQEGFGLSLVEALHCGNYCIASAIGGVPEVLQYGKLGKLIDNPHFVSSWQEAINSYLDKAPSAFTIDKDLYSTNQWNLGMNALLSNAKAIIENL